MGEGKFTPFTTLTPLNRQSPNIAHAITSTISPNTPHMVNVAPGVTSPHIAKVTTQFFFFFFVRKIFQPTWSSGRWTDFDMRYISRRVFTQGSAFGGQRTIFSQLHSQNPEKPHFWAHIMVSLWEIHIRKTAWCIEIWCWNLACCLTLPSTLSIHKSFSVRGVVDGRGVVAPTLNFRTPSLSRKLVELGSWNLAYL